MEAIWHFFISSPMLIVILVVIVGFIFSQIAGGGEKSGETPPERKVPAYKRFERREPELGDRRQREGTLKPHEDRRSASRRASDWIRGKR